MAILTVDDLAAILGKFNISTESWGTGKAKGIGDLAEEINNGESSLRINDDGIMRVTRIVKMRIIDPNNLARGILKEVFQILPDGRRRDRNQMPSGRIKAGEIPEIAMWRELQAELNINQAKFRLVSTYEETEEARSYPEMFCCYIIHLFEVIPYEGSDVFRDEFEIIATDDNIRHHFAWVVEEKKK
ncbi:MAG TPA: hypothetical protein DEV73_01760 [Candidatus Zambryskibacteria bacterium]|uniref:Nudix hydrolase domain-containing protein n=1 Tax=Candidatus Nomurabacteria bacterium RIFOXYC2_FULL_36_19 TaxID=1801806 RepID=A0A1F6YW92_9BACT|nr:MAG: hypothetical protein UR90_C0009G0007 [Parcubacteria group bacterium GW2011_GWC1_35_8]OGJ06364.1 MAG: hypothetical protein A2238_02635 [Candidatus Nomurabacteria bacterium RIFOXYA2_FULL_35_9]OGJ10654.1 MAG: hypothetical protein A2456_01530 [Candidatus Nomurabacteria bacterium RIFOXYC2_FULL_36_19]HCH59323.1 hypothetical protein [Candidatus Zambryskibacteria bacterium]